MSMTTLVDDFARAQRCEPDPKAPGFLLHRPHPIFVYRCVCGAIRLGHDNPVESVEAAHLRLLAKTEEQAREIARLRDVLNSF